MSSGGGFAPSQGSSNVATNVSPTTSQTTSAPSGGKGGYNSPTTMEDFAQQTPQVYMPPAQPTFYDQAFTNSYYNPGFQRPRMDYGLGGMGNAYARRMPMYSPSSPVEAQPPRGEMDLAPGGYDLPKEPLISDSWRNRRRLNFAPTEPVAATQGVVPEPNYSGGLGSLMGGVSRQGSDPLTQDDQPQFDPRINLSPNAFGDPSSASSYAGVPYGQLPVWMRG